MTLSNQNEGVQRSPTANYDSSAPRVPSSLVYGCEFREQEASFAC
jgi:hypothetical protein